MSAQDALLGPPATMPPDRITPISVVSDFDNMSLMGWKSPVGTPVEDAIARRARRDPEYRAELERIWPYEQIARQVIRLRMDQGLSQQALAERVGTTKSAISRLESGHHPSTVATLNKIALAFGARLVVSFEKGHPPLLPETSRRTATG
jgi:ribosome-binding protein aMBF1 (putative translation factor)